MAEENQNPPQQPPVATFLNTVLEDPELGSRIASIMARHRLAPVTLEELTELAEQELQKDTLAHLLEMTVNGMRDMQEQKVEVQYLREDQRLVLPSPLGMNVNATDGEWCKNHTLLQSRYLRLTTLSYAELKDLTGRNKDAIRARVDAIPLPRERVRKTDWLETAWYKLNPDDIEPESAQTGNLMFSALSRCLQFNCDFRDYGALYDPDMTVTDDAWKNVDGVQPERLRPKLRPMTTQYIAALNYKPVNSVGISAWTRAHGVALGILPALSSKVIREHLFTLRVPDTADLNAVIDFDRKFPKSMLTIAANMIAMFGLFHLNKDHTFKSGDSNMQRIGKSFLYTLRTAIDQKIVDEWVTNMESTVRTAQHPFGLAAPYWLAKVMKKYNKLSVALSLRINTTPPPVQRLMICQAAAREWQGMPIGRTCSTVWGAYLRVIEAEIELIKQEPPAYSGLAGLYGFDRPRQVSVTAMDAANQMMPCVYGYIKVMHTDERVGKDGLGHAQSLANVEREQKAMTATWVGAWENHVGKLDDQGLEAYLLSMVNSGLVGEKEAGGDRNEPVG